MIGQLAAGATHEINNALTGICGYTQLAMERQDLEEMRSSEAALRKSGELAAATLEEEGRRVRALQADLDAELIQALSLEDIGMLSERDHGDIIMIREQVE